MKNACFVLLAIILIALPISGYSQFALSLDTNPLPFDMAQYENESVSDTTVLVVNYPMKNVASPVSIAEVSTKELYSVYNLFKDKRMSQVILLLSKYGFKKKLRETINIVPKGTVDSLILVRQDDSKVIFSMVDFFFYG